MGIIVKYWIIAQQPNATLDVLMKIKIIRQKLAVKSAGIVVLTTRACLSS